MLDQLSSTCEVCDAPLSEARLLLAMTTDAGTRRAYECRCGAVVVTVVGDDASPVDDR